MGCVGIKFAFLPKSKLRGPELYFIGRELKLLPPRNAVMEEGSCVNPQQLQRVGAQADTGQRGRFSCLSQQILPWLWRLRHQGYFKFF